MVSQEMEDEADDFVKSCVSRFAVFLRRSNFFLAKLAKGAKFFISLPDHPLKLFLPIATFKEICLFQLSSVRFGSCRLLFFLYSHRRGGLQAAFNLIAIACKQHRYMEG